MQDIGLKSFFIRVYLLGLLLSLVFYILDKIFCKLSYTSVYKYIK